MRKMLPCIVLFAVLIPILFSSCEHAVKYKEVTPLSPKAFLTTEDAYLSDRSGPVWNFPFLGEESEVFFTYVRLKHRDVLIPKGSKIEISKTYAMLIPICGGPIPSCSMRILYFRIMDVKSKKIFWMRSSYKEISTDKFNQVRSVQIDALKSPTTGKDAIMSVPLNIWNEQDMVEYAPSVDKQ